MKRKNNQIEENVLTHKKEKFNANTENSLYFFTLNLSILFTGSQDKTAKQWNISNGLLEKSFDGHKGIVSSICVSNDGKQLFTGSHDNTANKWNI